MALVETTKRVYNLQFNPDTGIYYDSSPFKKNQRSNGIIYMCRCKCDCYMSTESQYKRHIGLNVHKKYVEEYKFINKELLDKDQEIIDFKREHNVITNKFRKCKKLVKSLKGELEQTRLDKEELVKKDRKIEELEAEVNRLKNDISEIDDYNISSEDENFEDCCY